MGNYSLFTIVCFIFASVAVGSYNREKMFPFTRVALGLNVASHAFFLKTLSSIALLGFMHNSKRAESSFALSQGPLLLCKCLYVFPLFFCSLPGAIPLCKNFFVSQPSFNIYYLS